MRGGQISVDLDGIAKLEGRFLIFQILQVSFALLHMLSLGFFGVGTAAQGDKSDQQKTRKDV